MVTVGGTTVTPAVLDGVSVISTEGAVEVLVGVAVFVFAGREVGVGKQFPRTIHELLQTFFGPSPPGSCSIL